MTTPYYIYQHCFQILFKRCNFSINQGLKIGFNEPWKLYAVIRFKVGEILRLWRLTSRVLGRTILVIFNWSGGGCLRYCMGLTRAGHRCAGKDYGKYICPGSSPPTGDQRHLFCRDAFRSRIMPFAAGFLICVARHCLQIRHHKPASCALYRSAVDSLQMLPISL